MILREYGIKNLVKKTKLSLKIFVSFSCTKCNLKNWHSSIALAKHIAESHHIIAKVCPLEGCILTGNKNIDSHIQYHHVNKTCHICDKVCKSANHLRIHLKSAHFKSFPYKCDKCDVTRKNAKDLKIHYNSAHTLKKHFCQKCDFFSYAQSGLDSHYKSQHVSCECEHCGLEFEDKKERKIHYAEEHGIE